MCPDEKRPLPESHTAFVHCCLPCVAGVQVGNCFHLAKNAGFKVIAHMMPDLPNVGWERDMESFREFFENPAFRTDGLKVDDMQAARLELHTGPHVCSSCCN